MPNDGVSFDQMTPNPKNGQMTRSFPNTGICRSGADLYNWHILMSILSHKVTSKCNDDLPINTLNDLNVNKPQKKFFCRSI